ncbi:stage III sporulation protein AF [Peribacillus sp. NJ4]|uniref:stage III sporulation protein AF n=1 Tax=Peribacillus sp. NJ4 TaxID=3055862 RepID=UPI0025A0ED63|nr:stage III sporulation protein AF [Peribacillus sp. NJ4]MDM5215102.1 stage III sporulation protein AF [Peribacillus sp. NJ4]
MSFFSNWISQLIVLILFITVIDMMLPNNSYRNVIRLVFSLVIIVCLISPILNLYKLSPQDIFDPIKASDTVSKDSLLNSIKEKEEVINKGKVESIPEILSAEMKNLVEKELIENYQYEIQDINLVIDELDSQKPKFKDVEVFLIKTKSLESSSEGRDESKVEPVNNIDISVTPKETQSTKDNTSLKKVKIFLAKEWGISPKQLTLSTD